MSAPLVHTRSEAIRVVAHALRQFDHEAPRFVSDARTGLDSVVRQISTELDSRRRALEAAKAALAAADEENYRSCLAAVERATDLVSRAEGAHRRAICAAESHAGVARRFLGETDRAVGHGVSMLWQLDEAIERYAAGAAGAVTPGAAFNSAGSAATGDSGGGGGLDSILAAHGLEIVSVDVPDYSENPVLSYDRGTPADYRWAVEKWDTVIAPGIEAGMGRDGFARKDAEVDAPDGRRLAGVYDAMLNRPITLARRADGSIDVNGGRHRLDAARQLGVTHLPVKWL